MTPLFLLLFYQVFAVNADIRNNNKGLSKGNYIEERTRKVNPISDGPSKIGPRKGGSSKGEPSKEGSINWKKKHAEGQMRKRMNQR